MAAKVVAVVPARLNSRRFAGKVLYNYKGKPLICHLMNELSKSRCIDRLIVATPDSEIIDACNKQGFEAMRTASRHATGSDRVAEIARRVKGDIFLNIQADNFGLKHTTIDRAIDQFKMSPRERFATLARPVRSRVEFEDSNVIKLVISADGYGLWFSRLAIPYAQNGNAQSPKTSVVSWAHIGVYLFRREALLSFARWHQSMAEKIESLEQLRILEHGEKIMVFKTRARTVSIETRQDLRKI